MLDYLLDSSRARLVGDLRGRVLEVGCGDGSTFSHYAAEVQVVALEPSEVLRRRAAAAAAAARAAVSVELGRAETLPFPDASFDGYVASLVFCSVVDLELALAEARRVLRPGAPARFLEHVAADGALWSRVQDAVNPLWHAVNGVGCNINRRTAASIAAAGFSISATRPVPLPWPFGHVVPMVEVYAFA